MSLPGRNHWLACEDDTVGPLGRCCCGGDVAVADDPAAAEAAVRATAFDDSCSASYSLRDAPCALVSGEVRAYICGELSVYMALELMGGSSAGRCGGGAGFGRSTGAWFVPTPA